MAAIVDENGVKLPVASFERDSDGETGDDRVEVMDLDFAPVWVGVTDAASVFVWRRFFGNETVRVDDCSLDSEAKVTVDENDPERVRGPTLRRRPTVEALTMDTVELLLITPRKEKYTTPCHRAVRGP